MKTVITLLALLCTSLLVNGQTMYSKAYGNPKNKALIFLHGGPGYNSVTFEVTTAQKLSDNGFYVIVYDRQGEGRSVASKANFTFDQTFESINTIYEQYKLKSATLLGHSFGGVIATLYAEKYPKKTTSVILIGAPLSMPETLSTIVSSSKVIYQEKNDSVNLNYIKLLEQMDKKSLQYSSYCFSHAMQNGFYTTKNLNNKAIAIYSTFKKDTLLLRYASQMTFDAPKGFWKNENYTSLNIEENLNNVLRNNTPVHGIYGKDDGLFSKEATSKMRKQMGNNNFEHLENCSHNVFIDQQAQFISLIKKWID